MTPLEDSFSCNFNVLIGRHAQGHGRAANCSSEWIAFREECVKRPGLL